MMNISYNQLAVAASVAISIGIAAIPSIYQSARAQDLHTQDDQRNKKSGTAVLSDNETISNLSDGIVPRDLKSVELESSESCDAENLNVISDAFIPLQTGFLRPCSDRNYFTIKLYENNDTFMGVPAIQGVLRRTCPADFVHHFNKEKIASDSPNVGRYTKLPSHTTSLTCTKQTVQACFGNSIFSHQNVRSLDATCFFSKVDGPIRNEESRNFVVQQAVKKKTALSILSSDQIYATRVACSEQSMNVDLIDISEGPGQLQYFEKFQRYLKLFMEIFLMDADSDTHPLTPFVRRMLIDLPRSIILEIVTCEKTCCELTMSNIQDLKVDIKISIPLKFFQSVNDGQNNFSVDYVKENITFFFEVLLEYLLRQDQI